MNLKAIGYWQSFVYPDFPDPGSFVDNSWNVNEKYLIIKKLNQGIPFNESTMGFSWCRFRCGAVNMGCKDLTNGIFVWPEGLVHYIEYHYVKLPNEIINTFLNNEVQLFESPTTFEIDYDYWKKFKGNNTIKTFKNEFDIGRIIIENKNFENLDKKETLIANLLRTSFGFTHKKNLLKKILDSTELVEINGRFTNINYYVDAGFKIGLYINFIEITQHEFSKIYSE